jgi:pectinesterase
MISHDGGTYIANMRVQSQNSAPAPAGGAVGKQAVALRISGDLGAFYGCLFYGAQDTLYDQAGRHYFKDCFIQGSIDYIFGDGQSIYQSCQLNSIAQGTSGSVTAQDRSAPGELTGFSFVGCTLTGSGTIYLGRAWGAYSRVVFIRCNITDKIIPAGWFDWDDATRQKTVFYGEYECTGVGANRAGRVKWSRVLTPSQAAAFSSLNFIDGQSWL